MASGTMDEGIGARQTLTCVPLTRVTQAACGRSLGWDSAASGERGSLQRARLEVTEPPGPMLGLNAWESQHSSSRCGLESGDGVEAVAVRAEYSSPRFSWLRMGAAAQRG